MLLVKKIIIISVFLIVYKFAYSDEKDCLNQSLEYLNQIINNKNEIDYKDTYVLLPVIMRNYDTTFNINDSVLNAELNLQHKMFCIQNNCFNNFKPDKKYFKSILKKWRTDPENIDVRMHISTHYSSFRNPPSLDDLLFYMDVDLYELTHAGFFLHFIEKDIGENPSTILWKNVILKRVHELIDNRDWMKEPMYFKVNLDLLFELFLVLSVLDELPPQYIQEVISYQSDDGGFKLGLSSRKSSTHATLIAIWILLSNNSKIIK